jgi:hypothetical protein
MDFANMGYGIANPAYSARHRQAYFTIFIASAAIVLMGNY